MWSGVLPSARYQNTGTSASDGQVTYFGRNTQTMPKNASSASARKKIARVPRRMPMPMGESVSATTSATCSANATPRVMNVQR